MEIFGLYPNWHKIILISFTAVASIQLFYYMIIFSRLAFFKQKKTSGENAKPVTVIICARDEAENLTRNLPGILVQKYSGPIEVLVVEDNSFDESKYILAEYAKSFPQLKVIELTQEAIMIPGKKFPLSIGIKSASYSIVLLTDADCVPATENWITSMQDAYRENTEIVLGYGAYHKKKGLLNKIIRWETYHSALQYLSYALSGIPYMGVGRNLSYKKEIFFRHKGFSSHHHIAGGDDDLFINMAANKKNTTINIEKDSFTLSKPANSFNQWLKQKRRHYSTSKNYKFAHKSLLGLYSLSHFLFYPLAVLALIINYKYALVFIIIRLLIQIPVFYSTMNKLNEKDLFPLFPIFDIGMIFYYLMFTPALLRKNKQEWK